MPRQHRLLYLLPFLALFKYIVPSEGRRTAALQVEEIPHQEGLDPFETSAQLSSATSQVKAAHPQLHAQYLEQPSVDVSSIADDSSTLLPPQKVRLVACTLLKNELPYLVEWIEFHKAVGFSRLVIYDDGSDDNVALVERMYREHGRDYVSYEANTQQNDPRMRRVNAAGECLQKYRDQADWIIHLDVDEFVWSPKYSNLQHYFSNAVSEDTHILYAGATRFGWEHMRNRFSYKLTEVRFLHFLPARQHMV